MRLSEKRIRQLSKKIARDMMMKGSVKCNKGPGQVADVVARVLLEQRDVEEAIEREARELVSRQKNLPPPGTGEYQAAYQKAKQQVAARRGIKY